MKINNLTIKECKASGMYQVISPSKIVLEEFRQESDAINFAKSTLDFVSQKTKSKSNKK